MHQSQLVLKCSFPIWSFLYIFLQASVKLSPSFHSFCSTLTNYFTALTLFFANAGNCPLYIARTCFFTCMYKRRVPFLFPILCVQPDFLDFGYESTRWANSVIHIYFYGLAWRREKYSPFPSDPVVWYNLMYIYTVARCQAVCTYKKYGVYILDFIVYFLQIL